MIHKNDLEKKVKEEKEPKSFFDRIKARKVGCSDYNFVRLEDQIIDNTPFLEGDDDFISIGDDL